MVNKFIEEDSLNQQTNRSKEQIKLSIYLIAVIIPLLFTLLTDIYILFE